MQREPKLRVQTGPSCWLYVLEYNDDDNDVSTTLQQAVKLPAYAGILKRYKLRDIPNASEFDLTDRGIGELEDTVHAVIIVGVQGTNVLYKDPNYGDIKLKVTIMQFKHMGVKLKTLITQPLYNLPKSRITELVD